MPQCNSHLKNCPVNCPSDTQFVLLIITCFLCQQDSSEIHFKVKMTTHLKKLKESYSQRQVGAEREPGIFYLITVKFSTNIQPQKAKFNF